MEERRKRKAKRRGRSDQVYCKLQDSGKKEEGKTFHKLHISYFCVLICRLLKDGKLNSMLACDK